MRKQMKNERAITLVALVITIIILLILAGIGITALTQTELFEKTKEARKITENSQELENSTLTNYDEKITEIIGGTTRDINSNAFKQIVTIEWQLTGFSDYKPNISSGVENIDISQYNFLKAPYAIVNGTRALTAYVDDITTTSLKLNWYTAWGSGLGAGFGMVRVLLVEPN